MKRIYSTLILIFFSFIVMQAQYVVYDVKGDVKLLQDDKETQIKKVQNLQLTDFVVINEGSKLVLLDVKNSQRATLKKASAGSLSTLIANEEGSILEATYSYLTHLLSRLRKSATAPKVNVLMGGNTFRDMDGDSLMIAQGKAYKVTHDVDSVTAIQGADSLTVAQGSDSLKVSEGEENVYGELAEDWQATLDSLLMLHQQNMK